LNHRANRLRPVDVVELINESKVAGVGDPEHGTETSTVVP
jgi:hypothetical protein